MHAKVSSVLWLHHVSLGGLENKIIATSPPFNFYISLSDTRGNILFLRASPSPTSINRLSIQIDALPLLHNIHDSFNYRTECNAVSSWHKKTIQYSCAAFPQAHLILSSSTPWNKNSFFFFFLIHHNHNTSLVKSSRARIGVLKETSPRITEDGRWVAYKLYMVHGELVEVSSKAQKIW